jgi:hypothetical protein
MKKSIYVSQEILNVDLDRGQVASQEGCLLLGVWHDQIRSVRLLAEGLPVRLGHELVGVEVQFVAGVVESDPVFAAVNC